MPQIDVERTYLELPSPDALRRAPAPATGDAISLTLEHPCATDTYRELYRAVGAGYAWHDRLAWSDAMLAEHLARASVHVWILRVDGALAGYFELIGEEGGSVEIGYFGLIPAFHGRGLGKYLLTRAAEEAWALGATRVWLHTCTLDDPAALPNYRARGFTPFRTERYVAQLPD